MAANRSVILNATKAADELHGRFGIKEALTQAMIDLPEHSAGGYQWQVEQLDGAGLTLIEDWRDAPDGANVGCVVDRHIAVRPHERGRDPLVSRSR